MNYELMLHELRRDYEELQEDMKSLSDDLEEKELLLSEAQDQISKLKQTPALSIVMSNEMSLPANIVEFIKSNYINALTRDLFGSKLDEEIQKTWVIFNQAK
jgi:ABC-type phosphate transport system auxiliary subunit